MPSFASALEKSSPNASASASRFSTWSPWRAWLIAALAAEIASGPLDAIVRATSSVFSSSSAGSKTPLTRPMRSASSASTTRPVRIRSFAAPSPQTRARRCVPPQPGKMPRLTSGWPSFAVEAA